MTDYVQGTSNIWPYYAAGNVPPSGKSGSTLGKDEFLKILIAQIQNQNPLQPMEDKEFIAQMAQFSSVEQLTNMSAMLERLSNSIGMSSSLIGKTIGWFVEDGSEEGTVRTGQVEAITVRAGKIYAVVNDDEIPLDSIAFVTNGESLPGGEQND